MNKTNYIRAEQQCGIHQSIYWPGSRKIPDMPEYDLVIDVGGDAMSPCINIGDSLLIKRSDKPLRWGEPYVLDTTNGTLIRYVYVEQDGEDYLCVSADPSRYPPIKVPAECVNGVFQVVAKIHLYNMQ